MILQVMRSSLRSFVPIIASAVIAVVILAAILLVGVPSSAADWGTLLSAVVSIVALGALLTTLSLQRDELALQRAEIARLASATQEQSLHARRQTLVESYRGLDEKIEQLFRSSDFKEILDRSIDPDDLKFSIGEMKDFDGLISSVNIRGIHNIDRYEFITSHHTFPINFSEDDGYGGDGQWYRAQLPIINFVTLSGIYEAAGMAKHIYDLASDLDLLEYARSVMSRRTLLEPLIYVSSSWGRAETGDPSVFCRVNPGADESMIRPAIDFHVQNKTKHYNLATSMISGARYNIGIFSPDAQQAVNADIIKKYPPTGGLKDEKDEIPF